MKDIATGPLDEEARAILRGNDRGGYTVPTAGLYPYQWNWDSAFAALGFAEFDIDRAWQEIETLFTGQWESGMVPHILFHKPDPGYFPGPEVWGGRGPIPSSGITQPPVAASFAWRIFQADPQAGKARASALFPKLLAWHRWFMTWRLDQGAVCIIHPWEAGRDNAPDWDGAMAAIDPVGVGEYQRRDTTHVDPSMRPTKFDYDRYVWLVQHGRRLNWDDARLAENPPFRVADPTMTFILMRAQRDLKAMGEAIGVLAPEIDGWIETLDAGSETLFNEDLVSFDSRDAVSGAWSGCVSSASFLCWYGGKMCRRMVAQYDAVTEMTEYPVPSYDPRGEHFDPKRYWRGPTWAMMNMLICIGMEEAGLTERARKLRATTARLIARHGFAEYFDPRNGAPAGGNTFTWTAATWLAWARDGLGEG